jgi:aldehyde:ferredoxin oxidoreductase
LEVVDMANMYSGNVLTVDLSRRTLEEGFLDDTLVKERVGGALLGLELWRRNKDGDPMVLGAGPLTGALVPAASSVALTARSPLTGGVVHASITFHAGAELKYAGYDFIVIRGTSQAPMYLWIHDEQAELLDAGELVGRDSFEITDQVREAQGDDRIQVLVAGPACQAGSLAASMGINYWVSTDRGALGALMGRKGLLAVAARGMGELEPYDVEAVGPASLRLLEGIKARAASPQHNWDGGKLDASRRAIAPLVHRKRSCFFCSSSGRPYLMLDDDPGIKELSKRRAPGVLVVDPMPLADLARVGLDGPAIGRMTRVAYRLGLDPARSAAAVREAFAADEDTALGLLEGLARGDGAPAAGTPMMRWDLGDSTGAHDAFLDLGVFTPANPPAALYEGVEGAERLAIQQGIAYIIGLCPAAAVDSGIDSAAIEEVLEAATGLGLAAADIDDLASSLIRETIALQPTGPKALTPFGKELRGRFT